jgi:uncharacterized protein
MSIVQQPFYLDVAPGRRLCVWRAPSAARDLRGVLVHVPALGEEMNKSRRMTAWTARELAGHGFGVLTIDLLGCGDSTGDFGDATWEQWIADVLAGVAWTGSRTDAPLWLWAHRAGALLASAALPKLDRAPALVLWQPVLAGKQYLTQLLRVKLASDLMLEAAERTGSGTGALREQLRDGKSVEVAGYTIAPGLALALDSAELAIAPGCTRKVTWLEVDPVENADLAVASRRKIEALSASGVSVSTGIVRGPRFWQAVEIEDCPALVAATVAAAQDEGRHERARDAVLL